MYGERGSFRIYDLNIKVKYLNHGNRDFSTETIGICGNSEAERVLIELVGEQFFSNKSPSRVSGFYDCENISKCFVYGKSYDIMLFNSCINIKDSIAEAKQEYKNSSGVVEVKSYEMNGMFLDCKKISNCGAKGEGAGFTGCVGVRYCYSLGLTGSIYTDSYASNSKTADYACADTPAGGFNDTTNPSA
jgi:hypothetical protein